MTLILNGTDGLSDVDGTAATPAIRGTDANTGIFFGTDIIGFSEGGVEAARINADAQFVAAAGTALLPVITTTGDVNTGIFFPAADTIAFSEGGAEAMRIDSSGNVGIGTITPGGRLSVVSSGNTSAANALGIVNSSLTTLFTLRNDGYFLTGTAAASPYNATSASAANVFVQADGGLYRSTSSLKYKTFVNNATHGLAELLALRPVTYKGTSKADGDKVFGGLIAEEVHEAGLSEFVQYAEDGTPDALAYGNMVSLCIKAIQEQQAIISAMETRLAALEA